MPEGLVRRTLQQNVQGGFQRGSLATLRQMQPLMPKVMGVYPQVVTLHGDA